MKHFSFILILEMLFLVVLVGACFKEPTVVTMEMNEWESSSKLEVKDYEDGTRGVAELESTGKVDEEILHSREHTVTPGAYRVTVNYKSACDLEAPSWSVKDSAGKLVLFSYKNSSALSTSTITLDDGARTRTSRLWVRWGKSVDDLQAKVLYNGVGKMTIQNVVLEEFTGWRIVRIFGFLFIFTLLDGCYLLFAHHSVWKLEKESKIKICGLGGIILFTSMLYFTDSLYYGHDLTFHLERMHALAEAFMEGQIPHRIQQNMLNGYGYVNPLFYGELFLSVPALLYCMFVPLQTCYKIYVVILNIATCLISYKCFTKMSKDWKIGMFATFLYTASAYRMIDIFVRADVGEYTAMTFLPLVVYGFWKVYTKEEQEKITISDYLPIVLGLSGILESHVLTCYMLALFIPIFVLLMWRKTFRIKRFLALVKSAVLVVLLNLWFVYPLLESMKMDIKVTQAGTMGFIEKYGITLSQMFGIFHTATGDSIWDGTKGEMPLTVGIGLMLAVFLFLYICIKGQDFEVQTDKDYRIARIGFGLGILALFFSSAYCAWDSLAVLNPGISQILGTIQFSWRYLEIATIMLTVVMIFVMKLLLAKKGRRTADIVMLGIVCIALLSEGFFLMQYPNEITHKKYYAESELTGFDVGSGMEYILRETDVEKLNTREITTSEQVKTTELVTENGQRKLTCENKDGKEGYADIPVLFYDNYHAFDKKSGEVISLETGENNQIRIILPANYFGTVLVKYQEPFHWRVLEVLLIVTLVSIIGYMIYKFIRVKKSI